MGGCCSTRKSVDLPTVPPANGKPNLRDYPATGVTTIGNPGTNIGSTNLALEED